MSFLDDLNPVQREAVQAVDGPVMIVAGAGSGKTRVLTYRVAHLLALGVPPGAIMALTFTNKAAGEMRTRIRGLVGGDGGSIAMGTFHSLFARLLRADCEALGYQRSFTIADRDDSLAVIKSAMNDLRISQQVFAPPGILARISGAKNALLSPEELRAQATDPWSVAAASVYEVYQRRLRGSNVMDFDDLLLLPLELFRIRPEVLRRCQDRYRYLLVDEYQDTNRVQYRLIGTLARAHRNICVVGDDAQSIYGFRGADIRNILDFERDYPDSRVFRLEQNYRSTRSILAAADTLIRSNRDQIPKSLWTENPEGEPVLLHVCADEREEGRRIVATIEEEVKRNRRTMRDFAVLYRTNAQSRPVEDALRRSGIPYTIVGGVAFYRRREIKDVLAYLRLLVNPRDDESFLRIVNVPPRGVGETTISRVRALAARRGGSLLDAAGAASTESPIGAAARSALKEFTALLAKYMALRASVSLSELARSLVDELGILRRLKEENTAESLERRANVQELLSALTEFQEQRPGEGLEGFLQEVALLTDADEAESGYNAVTLMTLHAAKGLEFPVVFITGLEEGLFPLGTSSGDRQSLEEERRLFYVGMTRAMQRLCLFFAQARYQYGERLSQVRSRFLDEIREHLVSAGEGIPARATASERRPSAPRRVAVRRTAEDPMPRYEDESQVPLEMAVGERVLHEAFGAGRIIVLEGRGENARAVVDFDSVGRKHLLLKFAHLRPG